MSFNPKRFLGVFAAVLILTSFSQAGSALPLPILASPNVSLMANYPGSAIGGKFGVMDGKTYYFETGAGGLRVFDASVPGLPLLVGSLALPHFENEDVDLSVSRKLLFISIDGSFTVQSFIYVISLQDPTRPSLLTAWVLPSVLINGVGRAIGAHTSTCIQDCNYLWVTGIDGTTADPGGRVVVVDVRNASTPAYLANFKPPAGGGNSAFRKGVLHDANVDAIDGTVWVSGSRGISAYSTASPYSPANPLYLADFNTVNQTQPLNDFIIHNSLRPSLGVLLVTEEDYLQTDNQCSGQGRFQTYSYNPSTKAIAPLDQWETDGWGSLTNGTSPAQLNCSAHWFDHQNSNVTIAWYQQGVRFLDVSDPRNIQATGYWLPPGGMAWASYFHPSDPSYVYVADATRGLDVLRFDRTMALSATDAVPPVSRDLPATDSTVRFVPSETFGFACPVRVA